MKKIFNILFINFLIAFVSLAQQIEPVQLRKIPGTTLMYTAEGMNKTFAYQTNTISINNETYQLSENPNFTVEASGFPLTNNANFANFSATNISYIQFANSNKQLKEEDGLLTFNGTNFVPFVRDSAGNLTAVTIGTREDESIIGLNSFSSGTDNDASGQNSHAEGSATTASGIAAHAEGGLTTAKGNYSHASGIGSIASNNYSFVWNGNVFNQYGSHGIGTFNINTLNGPSDFYIGKTNLIDTIQAYAGGGGTTLSTRIVTNEVDTVLSTDYLIWMDGTSVNTNQVLNLLNLSTSDGNKILIIRQVGNYNTTISYGQTNTYVISGDGDWVAMDWLDGNNSLIPPRSGKWYWRQ